MQLLRHGSPARQRRAHSGTSSRLMREAWFRARAIPELQAALKARQITLYRAGEIAKLPVGQQEIAVAQWGIGVC